MLKVIFLDIGRDIVDLKYNPGPLLTKEQSNKPELNLTSC